MEGVLGRIKKAINSPTGQGVLGAAAIGFNPLLGVLAAPAIANGRERRQLENDERRARMDLLSEQVGEIQARSAARDRSTEALGVLAEQLGGGDPDRQALFSVLGNIAPNQLAQSVLGQALPQSTKAPSSIAELDALGLPRTPENLRIIAEAKAAGGGINPQLEQLMQAVQLQLLQRQLADADTAANAKAQAEADAKQAELDAINDQVAAIGRANESLNSLDGKFTAPGSQFNPAKRAVSGFSGALLNLVSPGSGDDLQQQAADSGAFFKDSQILLGDMIAQQEAQTGRGVTRAQQQVLADGTLNENMQPETLRKVSVVQLEKLRRDLERVGGDTSQIDQLTKSIQGKIGGKVFEFKDKAELEQAIRSRTIIGGDQFRVGGGSINLLPGGQ